MENETFNKNIQLNNNHINEPSVGTNNNIYFTQSQINFRKNNSSDHSNNNEDANNDSNRMNLNKLISQTNLENNIKDKNLLINNSIETNSDKAALATNNIINSLNTINVKQEIESQTFELLYSPRTTYSNELDDEEVYFTDLTLNFDPITIKLVKKHFKERLGSLTRIEFISILKNHLLSWHPTIPSPQREKLLIKLLNRLFAEIDLNDNGRLEWAEFTNYIIHNSNSLNNKNDTDSFRLRFYSATKNTIDSKDLSENVSYAFYIEKHNLIGIVEDGKSLIHFYDANTLKRTKSYIDLKDIQKEIDDLDDRDLEERAKLRKKQQEENLKKLKAAQQLNKIKFLPKIENNNNINNGFINSSNNNANSLNINNMLNGNTINQKKSLSTELNNNLLLNTNINNTNKKNNNYQNNHVKEDEIYHPEIKNDQKKRNPTTSIVFKKLTAYCTIFLPEYDVLLVSASNKRISAWKYISGEFKNANSIKDQPNIDRNYFSCSILVTALPQYCMTWDSVQKILYTGQKDGKILKWDLIKTVPCGVLDIKKINSSKEMNDDNPTFSTEQSNQDNKGGNDKDFKKNGLVMKRKYEKRDAVSYILLINKIQILAASYFNGMIILWDTLLMEQRKVYRDHKTGVYHMVYDNMKNLLFSCGFDHNIYVYDPYISFHVYKLGGHYGSINTIICNEKENELISMDIFGNIKIWDSQMLVCFQTISVSESNLDNNGNINSNSGGNSRSTNLKLIYLKKQKKIMIYGNKIVFYETDKSLNPELADDQIIFSSFYDRFGKSFLSFSLRKIKIWNPFTGKIRKVYEDPMKNEITALTLDKNMKRVFLGDNMGNIKCFNMKNGKFLKNIMSHETEINILVHSLKLGVLISCSLDNNIKIHQDQDIVDSIMLKEFSLPNCQIKALILMDDHARVIIGLSNGMIRFFDIEHYRFDSDLNQDSNSYNEELTCMYYFEGKHILVSCYSSGISKLIICPPHHMKFTAIYGFYNKDPQNANNNIPVCCLDYDIQSNRLFTGDQLGIISCYSLKELFEKMEELGLNDSNLAKALAEIQIKPLWSTEAHKESIKHIYFCDVIPNFLITTSHDLRIKIFKAEDGQYLDELKQIANKFPPVPIGIKYRGVDPISKIQYEKTVYRKDLNKISYKSIDDIKGENIGEFTNEITIFNAKEKLLSHVKSANIVGDLSNKWNFFIDLDKIKNEESTELEKLQDIVKFKQINILKTEMMMQQKHVYNENYKPLFISEMNDEMIKEFSKLISQKLRHVKLAISKANLNQNKYKSLMTESDEDKNRPHKHAHKKQNKGKVILNDDIKNERKKKKQDEKTQNILYQSINEMNPLKLFDKFQEQFLGELDDIKKPFNSLLKKANLAKSIQLKKLHNKVNDEDNQL